MGCANTACPSCHGNSRDLCNRKCCFLVDAASKGESASERVKTSTCLSPDPCFRALLQARYHPRVFSTATIANMLSFPTASSLSLPYPYPQPSNLHAHIFMLILVKPHPTAGTPDEGGGVLELPPHHVGPLVQPQRQVAVAADPLQSNKRERRMLLKVHSWWGCRVTCRACDMLRMLLSPATPQQKPQGSCGCIGDSTAHSPQVVPPTFLPQQEGQTAIFW